MPLHKEAVHLKALKAGLEKLDTVAQWKGDLASLQAEVAKHEGKPAQLASDGHASAVKVAQLEGKLIKETSCAFCQKDLSDVPEVVQINSALAPQIAEQKAIYEQCAKDKKETEDYLQMLRAVLKHEMSISSALSRCAEHITLDRTNVPTTYTWTTEIKEAADASSDLAKAERALTARVMAEARAEVNKASLTRSEQELAEAAIAQENLPCKASAQGVIDQQVEGAKALELAHADLQAATVREAADKSALSRAVDANNRAMTEQAKAKAALQVMHIELAAMRENNALIKKVRLARPQITDKLWTVVLGAVSTYLSQVRGFPSIVTRESNKFKVNGVAVGGGGLSGSAKDALGLAMRIALVKMFLPNSSFMVLDEMAAACDKERETTMLGLVATAGFKQIILVTHSDLVDAFCDNIITL